MVLLAQNKNRFFFVFIQEEQIRWFVYLEVDLNWVYEYEYVHDFEVNGFKNFIF